MHAQLPMLSTRDWRRRSAAMYVASRRTKLVRGVAENMHAQCRVKRRALPVPFSNVFPGFIIFKGFRYTELVPVVR